MRTAQAPDAQLRIPVGGLQVAAVKQQQHNRYDRHDRHKQESKQSTLLRLGLQNMLTRAIFRLAYRRNGTTP